MMLPEEGVSEMFGTTIFDFYQSQRMEQPARLSAP